MASWEFGGRRRRRRRRSSGGGAPDAEGLLDEAAVRFDFSQYSDIDNMVDVNGGWGPLVVDSPAPTYSFTVDGLHSVQPSPGPTLDINIEGVASLIIIGPDGLTMIWVSSVDVGGAINANAVLNVDMAVDGLNNYNPEFSAVWTEGPYSSGFPGPQDSDRGPVLLLDGGDVVHISPRPIGLTTPPTTTTGVFVHVVVVDPVEQEVRTTHVSPLGRFDEALPWEVPNPGFMSNPQPFDTAYIQSTAGAEMTWREWDFWNRALTPSDVDTLIAHFTA